ncbi:MAG: universal stress protein [Pseudomonadales bacterium]
MTDLPLIRRILWACDPSRVNPLSVAYVQQLALWSEAEVWLVFVSMVPEETLARFRQRLVPPEQLQQTVEALRDEAVDPLAGVARELVRTGLAVRTRVVTGEQINQGILEAAAACDADLIVMGARQKSLLQRLFSPDEARATVERSTRPLLIIPEAAEERGEPASEQAAAADPAVDQA